MNDEKSNCSDNENKFTFICCCIIKSCMKVFQCHGFCVCVVWCNNYN